ncbi:hypothetical protein D0Y65_041445 [Glycine soja]|uniref:ATP-dependent DNA helicase n=1 Tax=Glycine soja TaxID=3848 RepID=A0A445GW31_GLYSO|nr:hypothetical protein D0Y65_041445 [Glycine soja]
MEQLYFDGMTICGHIGFPDLFLTLTCNPTWPEIQQKVRKSNLTPHDCPDVVSRIFKMKLNQLMNDLKSGHVFGGTVGCAIRVHQSNTCLSTSTKDPIGLQQLLLMCKTRMAHRLRFMMKLNTILIIGMCRPLKHVGRFLHSQCMDVHQQLNLGWILIKYTIMDGILLMLNMCPNSFMLHAKDAGNQENKEIQLAGSYGHSTHQQRNNASFLTEIENLVQANRKSLRDFPSMTYPIGYAANPHRNKLIYNEMAYDKEILAAEFNKCYHSLIVASSGIASLLLPGGRTTHSKFVIPVPATQNSTCNIHQGSDLAELLQMTKLIIWDEAPMCHKFSFEALNKSLKDIMHNNRPFGG